MAEKLLARAVSDRTDYYEWSVIGANPTGIQQGALQELAEAAKDAPVILLLPATEILHLTISLPVKSSSQLKKALPYAVEDLLANEVENYHLAWRKQPGDKVAVAAIELEKLHHYQQLCQDAAINLAGIYSEMLFVPCQPESCSIVIEQNRAIVRFGQWQGGGIDRDYLPLLVEQTLTESRLPAPIQIWSTQPCNDLLWPDTFQIDCQPIASALLFFCANMPKKLELNLLSDSYRSNSHGKSRWQTWLPSAALVLMAVMAQYGQALNSSWQSKAQLTKLETANQQLFKQTFPQLKRIVNIKTQAEQELITLRKTAGNMSHNGFLHLLYKAGEALRSQQNDGDPNQLLQLQAINFTNGVLDLRLTATDMNQIDTLKQMLERDGALKANIQSAETSGNAIHAHIAISGTPL
ncbi:MAG: type II secretion system protein GspL [Methylovulum sp.]